MLCEPFKGSINRVLLKLRKYGIVDKCLDSGRQRIERIDENDAIELTIKIKHVPHFRKCSNALRQKLNRFYRRTLMIHISKIGAFFSET